MVYKIKLILRKLKKLQSKIICFKTVKEFIIISPQSNFNLITILNILMDQNFQKNILYQYLNQEALINRYNHLQLTLL